MEVAVRTVQAGGEPPGAAGLALPVEGIDEHPSGLVPEGGLQTLDDPRPVLGRQAHRSWITSRVPPASRWMRV